MKLIGCGTGGGPKEPPRGLPALSVGARGWGSGPAGGRPRALLAGVELASPAAGIALPPRSFGLRTSSDTALLRSRLGLAVQTSGQVRERYAIRPPGRVAGDDPTAAARGSPTQSRV